MTYSRTVTANLYEEDGTTIVANALDEAFDINFMDELSGVGFGSVSLALEDPDVGELTDGRFVRILIEGTARFTFKIEGNPEYRQIQQGEEIAQTITASGRGWGCVFDDILVYPEYDMTLPIDSSWRLFSFASPNFPNASGWAAATQQYEYQDAVTGGEDRVQGVYDTAAPPVLTVYPAPIGFPWPNSQNNGNGSSPTPTYVGTYWIWPSAAAETDIGYAFFRDTFTLATASAFPVTFSVTADNLFTLFLEGVPILGEDADTWMWQGYKEVTILLPAGTYQVAAVVENTGITDGLANPGGFIYAAYVNDTNAIPTAIAHVTDSNWETEFDASVWPGWTPGQIITQFTDEAIARGGLAGYTYLDTYGAAIDTDGNDWDSLDTATSSIYIPSFAIRVGATGIDLLNQLNQEGWIDWHFKPGALTLDAWAGGQVGSVSGVSFVEGTNIGSLERGSTKPYANVLLVQWADSMIEVVDSSAVTAYGTRVEDVYSTDADTEDDATRLGRIELARRVVDAKAAVVMVVEPVSAADCPYEAFGIGDYVTIPNTTGGTTSVQVLSISVRQDDQGFAEWTLELNKRWRVPEREQSDLLRSIGGKTQGSVADRGVVE